MTDPVWALWAVAGAAGLAALFALLAWIRCSPSRQVGDPRIDQILAGQERLERALREEQAESQRQLRAELSDSSRALRAELSQGDAEFRAAVARDAAAGRSESAESLARFASGFSERLQALIDTNERRIAELRQAVEARLLSLQTDNGAKLDEMRRMVDEKLHATLEQRLGQSFRQVSESLEAVLRGLGEMQALASGVGDLKRVLTNVKTRGTWGEVQLERLIEDTMTPEQFGRNVRTVPGSDAQVEFAIRLPGGAEHENPVWLPIDAKFPKEEYERLMDAQEAADRDGVRMAGAALARAVEVQARQIVDKYVSPPATTDFAIMFLPSESLYAEVLRQPGLMDRLHELRVNVAGPANFSAMLNSLQMGFRTLAIPQRSSEVWRVLGAVKTEFGKFGEALAAVRKSLDSAASRLGKTETRARVMLKSLRNVEALPDGQAVALIADTSGDALDPDDDIDTDGRIETSSGATDEHGVDDSGASPSR